MCLVHEDGAVRPIKGTFDTASVVVLPIQNRAMEILRPLAQPTDIFAISEGKQKSQTISWLMSCGEHGVDFFQLSSG